MYVNIFVLFEIVVQVVHVVINENFVNSLFYLDDSLKNKKEG